MTSANIDRSPPVLAILAYLAAMNLAAFALFLWDKRCARLDARRVPERTLLGISALGGSLGAYAGQRVARHKTSKQPFQSRFRLIVALQVAVIATALAIMVTNALS